MDHNCFPPPGIDRGLEVEDSPPLRRSAKHFAGAEHRTALERGHPPVGDQKNATHDSHGADERCPDNLHPADIPLFRRFGLCSDSAVHPLCRPWLTSCPSDSDQSIGPHLRTLAPRNRANRYRRPIRDNLRNHDSAGYRTCIMPDARAAVKRQVRVCKSGVRSQGRENVDAKEKRATASPRALRARRQNGRAGGASARVQTRRLARTRRLADSYPRCCDSRARSAGRGWPKASGSSSGV